MALLDYVKQSFLVHIWFFGVFILSGLIVNVLQVFTLVLWPISKSTYRLANGYLAYLHWAQLVFLYDTYSGSHIYLHCDSTFFDAIDKNHGLIVMNHKYDLDWLTTWCVADRFNQLYSAKCFMKNELKYVPLVGWSFSLLEMPFLKRDFTTDRKKLIEGIQMLTEFPMPCKMLIFCEGTRFTEAKHEQSKAFARKKGLPVLKHHLTPRTKGFSVAVEAVKGKVPYILDTTIARQKYHENDGDPSVYDLLMGKKVTFHAFIKIRMVDDVPTDTEEASSIYCHQLYQEKDKIMDYFLEHNTFYGYDETFEQRFLPPSVLPTLVAMFWYAVLGIPMLYYIWRFVVTGSVGTISIAVIIIYLLNKLFLKMVSVTVSSRGSTYGSKDHKRTAQNTSGSSTPTENGCAPSVGEGGISEAVAKKDE